VGHLITSTEKKSGKITINGVRVPYRNGLTRQQALDLLTQDLHPFKEAIRNTIKVKLDPCQFAALVSFAFNVGINAFKTSTLVKELNQGKYDEVPNQLRSWRFVTVRGRKKESRGLTNRRKKEIKLWNRGTQSIKSTKPKEEPTYYVIERGDTLWGIAKRYKTTVDKLKRLNPGVDPKKLKPGDKIKIPPIYYVIKPGDTLWGIAKRFGIELDELMKLNPEKSKKPKKLQIGDKIKLREEPGDILRGLVKRFGIKLDELKRLNPALISVVTVIFLMSVVMCALFHEELARSPDTRDEKAMIFIFGSSGDAVRLDPADVTDGESIQRLDNIHEGLVRYKAGTTEIEPCLATDWDVSADKLTITFSLRKDVQFHHGYGEMTADDVVFSFERQYNADNWYHDKGEWAYWGYMFTDIDYIEKIDDYKVAIHMKRPNASIMTSLAMFTVCIVSEDAAKDYENDYFANPVGTGPFEFVSWVKDDQITLRAFDDYWGGRAQIDELIFKVITDPSARLMALQAGEVHGIEHIDPRHVDIIKDDPCLMVVSQAGMNVGYIALNCGEGYTDENENEKWDYGEDTYVPGAFAPFQDIRVRRAIAHAINKEAIVRNLYQGAATVAVQGMPPVLFGYDDAIVGYDYDPEKAKQLLADAGYPNGFAVSFWYMPVSRPYFPVPAEIAEAIQADLAEIGITAGLFTEDWGTYLQDTEAGKHHMAMLGWTGDNGDPDNFLNVLYSQDKATLGTAGNIGFKKNPEFQSLLDQALANYDQDERAELYKEANKLLVDQCSHVFIAHSDQNLAFLATVYGYIIHPTSRKFFYPVWVEAEEGGEGLGSLFAIFLIIGGMAVYIKRNIKRK